MKSILPYFGLAPLKITVVLKSGIRIPAEAKFRGFSPAESHLPRFELVAESVDWRELSINRVELGYWPDGTVIGFDLPGWSVERANEHVAQVKWIENGNELYDLDVRAWEDHQR